MSSMGTSLQQMQQAQSLLAVLPSRCRSKVHVIDEQSSDVEYEQYEDSVLTVYTDESIRHVSTGPLYTEMMLPNKTAIKLQIDSGATVNVISAKHVDMTNVMSSSVKLKMYNNTSLRPLGKCLLLLENPANGLHPSSQQESSRRNGTHHCQLLKLEATTFRHDEMRSPHGRVQICI